VSEISNIIKRLRADFGAAHACDKKSKVLHVAVAMAIRKILHYPDKRLRIPAEPVTDFGAELQQLVDDMAETK
jgi:hypothetical protein